MMVQLPWNAFIAALLVLAIIAVLGASIQHAFGASPEYCKLFTREFSRVAMAHNRNLLEEDNLPDQEKKKARWAISATTQRHLLDRNYSYCLNKDDPPSLPNIPEASDQAFIEFITAQQEPTVDHVENSVAEALRKIKHLWCREEYKTYDPDNGTVIRRGSKERVECPFDERVYATDDE